MWRVSLAAAAAVLFGSAAAVVSEIRVINVTADSGLSFYCDSSPTPNRNQPETMVSGVALIDYDRDGWLDVYFVNGAAIPSLKKETPRLWNRLFRNNRDGTFADVTEKAGVQGAGYGMGAAAGDYDNDGWPDLFVANVTDNQLYRNNRDGTFTDVTGKAGVAGAKLNGRKMWGVAAGWFDMDNDGDLDLFVSNYCVWEVNKDPFCGPNPQTRAYCHPDSYEPLPNTLYRNNGDGTFTDVSRAMGVLPHLGKGMGVAFADFDHDGWMDVFVANDNAPNFLFHNRKGRFFEEVAMKMGVAFPESGAFISGMGADFRDLDNDGWEDIWHTAIEGETFPLYRNLGEGRGFEELTHRAGLGHTTRNMSAWSCGAFDLDNDGWRDLVTARGNVQHSLAMLSMRPSEEPLAIFRNLGNNRFADVTEAAGADAMKPLLRRGLAYGDLDNDGRIDFVTTTLNGHSEHFRNITGNGNHWILFALEGTRSNRMAIGARIRITTPDGITQVNHATTSTGYSASSDHRVHFGLGKSELIRTVDITWPSGARQTLENVKADQILAVREPAPPPRPPAAKPEKR
jgi:hypothetical protein